VSHSLLSPILYDELVQSGIGSVSVSVSVCVSVCLVSHSLLSLVLQDELVRSGTGSVSVSVSICVCVSMCLILFSLPFCRTSWCGVGQVVCLCLCLYVCVYLCVSFSSLSHSAGRVGAEWDR